MMQERSEEIGCGVVPRGVARPNFKRRQILGSCECRRQEKTTRFGEASYRPTLPQRGRDLGRSPETMQRNFQQKSKFWALVNLLFLGDQTEEKYLNHYL